MAQLALLAAIGLALGLLGPTWMAHTKVRVQGEARNDNAARARDANINQVLGRKAGQDMAVSLVPGESNGNGRVHLDISPRWGNDVF